MKFMQKHMSGCTAPMAINFRTVTKINSDTEMNDIHCKKN